MKRVMTILAASLLLSFSAMNASADDVRPGAYTNLSASQVMNIGKTSGTAFRTQVQIGANDRAHANYVNQRSGAGRSLSNSGNGGGADFQWGSSQQENSWKAAKTYEEAMAHGITASDCQGDNSDGKYRAQMNQNRKGFMTEPLVPQSQCHENHKTLQ
ncbi:MAG: hypothetical protein HN474_01030 [Nitrospina sp.]|nr:hypothetical protein [Nitrospina sp.]